MLLHVSDEWKYIENAWFIESTGFTSHVSEDARFGNTAFK
jgi:hypothetical protein